MGSSSDWNLIKLASVRFQICLVANLKKMMVIFVTRSVKSHARMLVPKGIFNVTLNLIPNHFLHYF